MKRAWVVGCGDTLDLGVVEDEVILSLIDEVVCESNVLVLDCACSVLDRGGRTQFVNSLELMGCLKIDMVS